MSCQKASYIIEKRNVSKITRLEKFQLKFHLAICKLCKKYENDSRIVGKILRALDKQTHKLSPAQKEEIKAKLQSS